MNKHTEERTETHGVCLDTISRQAAIDALIRKQRPVNNSDGTMTITMLTDEVIKDVLKALPSAQPEYYDYSDIDYVWKYYAEEQDINLTDGAKQLKDAMWVGYRKGKQDAQSDIIRCKDCKHKHIENMVWTCPFGLPGGPDFYCGYGAGRRTFER